MVGADVEPKEGDATMNKGNAIKGTVGVAAAGVFAVALALAAAGGAGAASTAQAADSADEATYQDWKSAYPDEYGSFATHYYDHVDGDEESHFQFRYKQDGYATATSRTGACMSCKSTSTNTLYAEYGDDFFAQSVEETGAEEKTEAYWDCQVCHTSIDDLTLGTNLVVFNTYGADEFAGVDEKVLVCGQCHNASGAWTYNVSSEAPLDSWDPYRYGHDADAMYKAYTEDMSSVDEETGASLATLSYDDLEMFVDSTHASLGLTCVDCHMTTTTDGNNNEFTSHNASSSPLENPEALAKCVECHSAQGVETAQDMVDYYGEVESELADKMDEALAAQGQLHDVLAQATAEGVEGEAIDQARECYAQVHFFNQYVSSYRCEDRYRVAHNADYMNELAARMLTLAEQGLELMEA